MPEAYGLWIGCTFFGVGVIVLQRRAQLAGIHRAVEPWLLGPWARVGAVSYALYLLHVPVLRACVAVRGDNGTSVLVAILLSFALAYLVEPASLGAFARRRQALT